MGNLSQYCCKTENAQKSLKPHNINFTILTSFKCTVQWCCTALHQISRNFSSCKPESTVSPLNISRFLPHLVLVTTTLLSVLMNLTTLDTSHKWNHTDNTCLFVRTSFHLMSSRFIHIVACDRMSFFKAKQWSIVCI